MATHSSILAWRIPGTGEPAGLPSMGSHRVGQDWSNLAAAEYMYVTKSLSQNYIVEQKKSKLQNGPNNTTSFKYKTSFKTMI